MFVEIRKAGFVNKGAELMLLSAKAAIESEFPEAKLVIPPNATSVPYEKYARLGFFPKASYNRFRIPWGKLGFLIPQKIRKAYGIILDEQVDVVLDAAGFSYSDQWGVGSSLELAKSAKRWRRNGTKVILLPQAFGPFTNPRIKAAIQTIADNADMIYAREKVSYQHLTQVVGARPNIKMAPDFTCLIEGKLPDNYDNSDKQFCIVPNYRMVDKTTPVESKAYLPFLINCAKYLLEKETHPFLLIHEGANDLMLAEEVIKAVGKIPIVKETDPLKIKGILGACNGTIGSRFHGLVSALSQGVPSLATGWSHKYQMLFDDYAFSDGLLNVTDSTESLRKKIDMITDTNSLKAIRQKLLENSAKIKAQSTQMWQEVYSIIQTSNRI